MLFRSRYLTGDVPELAAQAASIIDSVAELSVTDAVLAESAYVLTTVYDVPREVVVDHLVAFLRKRNVKLHSLEKENAITALLMCRPSRRVSFVDALIWAAAYESESKVVYTLDRRFPSDGIEVRIDV